MKFVTNTVPLFLGVVNYDDNGIIKRDELETIKEGTVFKVTGIDFCNVCLEHKGGGLSVQPNFYEMFFDEHEIEV